MRPDAATAPTHSAFAQQSANQSPGSPYPNGLTPPMWSSDNPSSKAPVRQGALYGSIEALQSAVRALSEAENTTYAADTRTLLGGNGNPLGPPGDRGTGVPPTPEEVWQWIPSGGEAVWKAPQPRQSLRLRVARLQEALSEAASGLQKAQEACSGAAEDELGTGSLSSPAPATALRHEYAALEAESKELSEEKLFLDARLEEVKQELARAKAALQPPTIEPSQKVDGKKGTSAQGRNSPAPAGDVSEMAVVLRLLACLKDVALNNRSVILPVDPAKWTREQQVVAYFLDEVEASQVRLDGGY